MIIYDQSSLAQSAISSSLIGADSNVEINHNTVEIIDRSGENSILFKISNSSQWNNVNSIIYSDFCK